MKILRILLICIFPLIASGCRKSEDVGKVDDWTWDAPDLKTRTSPDRSKRVRADIKNGKIQLAFGEAGRDHPVDLEVEHTEIISAPANGNITMKWGDDSEFIVDHPDLGTKAWTVEGRQPMTVTVKAEWHPSPRK
jgi:hypothetical protein